MPGQRLALHAELHPAAMGCTSSRPPTLLTTLLLCSIRLPFNNLLINLCSLPRLLPELSYPSSFACSILHTFVDFSGPTAVPETSLKTSPCLDTRNNVQQAHFCGYPPQSMLDSIRASAFASTTHGNPPPQPLTLSNRSS